MTAHPRVSVVIPTHNRADLLGEALDSALAQTVPPAEVIVLDDASTDDTPDLVARYGAPVRYVRQERAGQSAARNRGAAAATGEYIAMLDSDDVWEPAKLERQLALHRAAPSIAWSVTDCLVVDAAGRPRDGEQGFRRVFAAALEFGGLPEALFARYLERRSVPVVGGERTAFVGDLFELLFRGNLALPSSGLVRGDAWDAVGGFDTSFHSATDTEFFHRLAAKFPGGVLMDRLTRYRLGSGGQVSVPARSIEKIRNAMRAAEVAAAMRDPLPPSARAAYDEGRRTLLRRLAWTHLANFEPGPARAALAEYRRDRGRLDPAVLAWHALALLPPGALRSVHALKRTLAGTGGQ
jgi:glycosyltransferase involved in cell wall biosynthesis